MDGVVVIAGRFQAGSVVKLYRVQDDAVFRSEGGELVGERLVDADGNVGFDQLEIGAPHIAAGYVDGGFLEFRCKPADVSQPSDFSQPPTPPATAAIGTQGAPDVEVPPAPPVVEEGDEPLPVGVPEGVPIETGTHTYFLHTSTEAVDSASFEDSGVQAPAETAADGTVLDARPLYNFIGAGDPPSVDEGWEAYEGPTEQVGTTPAQSTFTDVSGSEPPVSGDTTPPAPAAPAADAPAPAPEAPAPDEAAPASPDVPAPDPAPSETPVESEVTVSAPAPATVETTPDVTVLEPTAPAPVAEGDTSSPAPTEGGDAPVSPDEPAQSEATDGGAQAAAPSESAPAPSDAEAPAAAGDAATPEAAAPEAPVEAEAPAAADAPVEAPAEDAPAPDAPPADAPAEAPAPAPADATATDAPPAQEGA